MCIVITSTQPKSIGVAYSFPQCWRLNFNWPFLRCDAVVMCLQYTSGLRWLDICARVGLQTLYSLRNSFKVVVYLVLSVDMCKSACFFSWLDVYHSISGQRVTSDSGTVTRDLCGMDVWIPSCSFPLCNKVTLTLENITGVGREQ